MMTKIAILMGMRASQAWKENLFFSFIVNDWDKSMVYLQEYREKAAGSVMGMEVVLQVQSLETCMCNMCQALCQAAKYI